MMDAGPLAVSGVCFTGRTPELPQSSRPLRVGRPSSRRCARSSWLNRRYCQLRVHERGIAIGGCRSTPGREQPILPATWHRVPLPALCLRRPADRRTGGHARRGRPSCQVARTRGVVLTFWADEPRVLVEPGETFTVWYGGNVGEGAVRSVGWQRGALAAITTTWRRYHR